MTSVPILPFPALETVFLLEGEEMALLPKKSLSETYLGFTGWSASESALRSVLSGIIAALTPLHLGIQIPKTIRQRVKKNPYASFKKK